MLAMEGNPQGRWVEERRERCSVAMLARSLAARAQQTFRDLDVVLRTTLDYLLEPITNVIRRGMRET
jgi:hypothetical protein